MTSDSSALSNAPGAAHRLERAALATAELDRCSCGADIAPVVGPYELVERRMLAFARHQADTADSEAEGLAEAHNIFLAAELMNGRDQRNP